MSKEFNFLNGFVEQKLLQLHTSYLGKVTAYDEKNDTWTIQPLMNINLQAMALVKEVMACKHVKADIEIGSTVLCVVCERDISSARNGQISANSYRKHDISDSVIVGVI